MAGNKPPIATEDAVAFLRSTVGEIEHLHSLSEGEESRAFGFRWNGEDLVLRINASRRDFDMDRMAGERFGAADLPIPAIRLIAPMGRYYACVSERALGTTLQDLAAGGAYDYGRAICSLLDRLERCDMARGQGYGPISPDGLGRHSSWSEFLLSMTARDWTFLSPVEAASLPQLLGRIESEAGYKTEVRRLIHGDFGSNNVLVADGRVTGLIDWSEAMVGDSLYDLANIFFWRPWLDCMEQQCRYVNENEPHRLDQRDRLVTYAIHIGLGTAYEAAKAGDGSLTDWALDRCHALLEDGL